MSKLPPVADDRSPAPSRDIDRNINVFDPADYARRFADRITTLHSQAWRFAAEHEWNFDLLRAYRTHWRSANKLRFHWR